VLQTMRSAAKYIWIFIIVTFVGVFLFAETSGLTSRGVTRGTTIGSVNGEEITYDTWLRTYNNALNAAQQRSGRALTLDDVHEIEDQAFEQLVNEMLLAEEYERRGISVTNEEIRQAAAYQPPPELMQNPELQTEGRFDLQKYQRMLSSPAARQGGLLAGLEAYYRSEIPKQKLFNQVVTGVYVPDSRLWRMWQDERDSVQVSYVAFTPGSIPDSVVKVSNAEVREHFRTHQKDFGDSPGRAVLSLVTIPRVVSPTDSAAARDRALSLRKEIVGGAKFEDVAKRESADSGSAANGGSLGRGPASRFVPEFAKAAMQLKPGVVSEPVLSPFGYHLIRVDERQRDTLSLRHVLIPIVQSDSAAARTDRRADSLANLAAGSEQPTKFDSAAKNLGLSAAKIVAVEGERLIWNGRYVPSISAWAFGGAKVGETSDLIDADDAYYLARLDSLTPGGKSTVARADGEIRRILTREKKIDMLLPRARKLADAVAAGTTLEQAAKEAGLTVEKSPVFTRLSPVPGMGRLNAAIGAAFGIPVGAVSAPVKTSGGVYVIRVDRRVTADRAAWEAQKKEQRERVTQQLRRERLESFLSGLRLSAEIEDRREAVQALTREAST
jgi:peptidyl-prolyl cis-trans isomerase D